MFKANKTYRIFRGKVTTGGNNTMLSISESTRDAQTGQWTNNGWWSVCVSGVYPCERQDEVKFTPSAITGISQREYGGKNYYTIFADGKIEYKGQTYQCGDTVSEGGFTEVKDDGDLPF